MRSQRLATRYRARRHSGSYLGAASGRALRFEQLELRAMLSVLPVGGEFRVNSFTTSDQFGQSVAMDANGDFVVVWNSFNQDGDLNGIYAQRFNSGGIAQGSEFRVNSHTTDRQERPSVAMDADGDFVVVWDSLLQDGSSRGIYAQRYNASAVAQGVEFRVNTTTTGSQDQAGVAMDADGDFVVVWTSAGQDSGTYGVYAQRYNSLGVAQGGEFRVNTYTTDAQIGRAIGMDSNGDFVAAWRDATQDGSSSGVYAQRFNAAGAAQGAEFRVNSYTTGHQRRTALAMDDQGDFVIAWVSNLQDGNNYGVYAQRYSAAGVPQGTEFRVNTHTTNTQDTPFVAMDADGDFVIAWTSFLQDGVSDGVFAQAYDAAGVPQGSEFQVNTFTSNGQANPAIAMDSDGDFVIVWNSSGQDGSASGVYAQRYSSGSSLTPYPGDYNPDGIVDAADYVVWRKMQGATGLTPYDGADGDGDGDVDTNDLAVWKAHFGDPVPPGSGSGGDYNRDLTVNAADYVVWRKMQGATGLTPFAGADGDGDGDVDLNDLAVWKAHFGDIVPPPGSGSGAEAASSNTTNNPAATQSAFEHVLSAGPRETPRRLQHPLTPSRAIRTDLDFDKLLLSVMRDDDSGTESASPARSGRGHEYFAPMSALDEVFNALGRNSRRRERANTSKP